MVLLTFDDQINEHNIAYYDALFAKKRINPNGCPIEGTFFVSNNATDYNIVANLWKRGHEIADHTVSHRFPLKWWGEADYTGWEAEIRGQQSNLVERAGIPKNEIKGFRAPFLQVTTDEIKKIHVPLLIY